MLSISFCKYTEDFISFELIFIVKKKQTFSEIGYYFIHFNINKKKKNDILIIFVFVYKLLLFISCCSQKMNKKNKQNKT